VCTEPAGHVTPSDWRVLKTALLLGLEFLEAAFLAGLYEYPVAALVTGVAGGSRLAPGQMAAA